MPHMEVQFI